jgi:hypothetical protein
MTCRSVLGACLVVLLAPLSGCAGRRNDAAVVVRDSGGIEIVESLEGAWGPGEGWSLSEGPVVSIGREDGPQEYLLDRVRAALLLPDHRILVANGGTNQLRYFDSSGTYLYSVGRNGSGPGEFNFIVSVCLARDSLVVFDGGQSRISVFSISGDLGRTLTLGRTPLSRPFMLWVFADGRILAAQLVFDGGGAGLRRERTQVVYRRYSPNGAVLDSLGVFLLGENYSESSTIAPGASRATDAPFGRRASTNVSGSRLYYASSETYDIQVFDSAGRLDRIIRRPVPNRPVTSRDIEAFKARFVEGSGPGSWNRRIVGALEFPETMPAFGTVVVDALDNVWVAEYSGEGRVDRTGRWTVFDPGGHMLGVVEIPRGGRVTDIGADYLMGVWRTELDVPEVRMYRLFRR